MNKISFNRCESIKKVELSVKDLRCNNHAEFNDFDDLQKHINNAINSNGIRYYSSYLFETIYNKKPELEKIGLINHMYQLIGGAKGTLKYRFKHSKSTLSRYINFNYETLDLLRAKILLKHKGKIYKGYNGYQRIEVINSVNLLCKDIENPIVLEAGCGSGLNMYLLNTLNDKIDLHGFEYTNSRLASAIVNLSYSKMVNNLFLADVCKMNLPDNCFDVVYTNHVIEQLGQKNAEKAINEMWRVCRKGIVLSEPSVYNANMYEKWRMNILGYCKDLYRIAEKLPSAKIIDYKEDTYRTYPNTSQHLIVIKY